MQQVSEFQAIPMRFAFASTAKAIWKKGPAATLEQRDLLLATASDNQMRAAEIRATAPGTLKRWPGSEEASFIFLYPLRGTIEFNMADGTHLVLKKRDVVLLSVLREATEIRFSEDFGAIEIAAPGVNLAGDVAPLLRIPSRSVTGSWESHVCRNRKEAFIRGDGPRNFFTYRELGAVAETGGRIKICDGDESGLGPIEIPEGGTGWHTHSMSQFFMILNGGEEIEVEGQGRIRMTAGDAMMLGRGTRHNVTSFTPDFSAFEMCLPGDYDTVPAKAP